MNRILKQGTPIRSKLGQNTPRRGVLWFASIAMALFTGFMSLFFAQRGWRTFDVVFVAVCIVITFGLIVTLVDSVRFWWGMRLVTSVIFSISFWYVLNEGFIHPHGMHFGQPGEASLFNAVRGFLFFGLPSLLYTLWGSTWGKLGTPGLRNVTRADFLVLKIAIYSRWLFLAATLMTVAVAFFHD